MELNISDVDIKKIMFTGLSMSYHRKIVLVATLLIMFVISLSAWMLASYVEEQTLDMLLLSSVLGFLVVYLATGVNYPARWIKGLFELTPLSVLYRLDMDIVNQSKEQCLMVAEQVDFKKYWSYGRINPLIRSKATLEIIEKQKNGELVVWTKNVVNLKSIANLIYQIYLAEQLIREGEQC